MCLLRDFSALSLSALASLSTAFLLVYLCILAIYRLFLSPAAKFPGPRLIALNLWYEFYYDIAAHSGTYLWEIEDMYERYSSDAHKSPFELPIEDLDFYGELYDELHIGTSIQQMDNYARNLQAFDGQITAFENMEHDLRRLSANALNHFSAEQIVAELGHIIQRKGYHRSSRFVDYRSADEPLNALKVYSALAVDIVNDYAFSRSIATLDNPDFGRFWHNLSRGISYLFNKGEQFPNLVPLMLSLRVSMAQAMDSDLFHFLILSKTLRENIIEVQHSNRRPRHRQTPRPLPSFLLDSTLAPCDFESLH